MTVTIPNRQRPMYNKPNGVMFDTLMGGVGQRLTDTFG